MLYQEKLIKFCKKKNAWIKALTGLDYMIDVDFDYIRKFDNIKSGFIYNQLVNNIFCYETSRGLKGNTCIFCIENKDNCDLCFYRIIHKKCNSNSDNTYSFIIYYLKIFYKDDYPLWLSDGLYRLWLQEIENGE